jgi:hypothetical protein
LNSIKFASKNNYTISDFKDWADYIDLLLFWEETQEAQNMFVLLSQGNITDMYQKNEIDNKEE